MELELDLSRASDIHKIENMANDYDIRYEIFEGYRSDNFIFRDAENITINGKDGFKYIIIENIFDYGRYGENLVKVYATNDEQAMIRWRLKFVKSDDCVAIYSK